MTRDEILNMDGPELGVLLIEHVVGDCCIDDGFGSTWAKYGIEDGLPVRFEAVRPGKVQSNEWRPGESISDAWEVVEKMESEDFWCELTRKTIRCDTEQEQGPFWFAWFRCVRAGIRGDHEAFDKFAPLAICRAALIATLEGE